MKSKYVSQLFLILGLTACSLNYDPVGVYSDVTEGIQTDSAFATKADVITFKQTMYHGLLNLEHMYQDLLLVTDVIADNAYAGNTGGAAKFFDYHNVGSMITAAPLQRDWNRRMNNIALANRLAANVDKCPDEELSDAEHRQFRAEALIYRAMLYYDMVLIWGRVPIIIMDAGDITAENIDDAYEKYFPKQNTEEEVYRQIEEDLLTALPDAPTDNSDKSICTKGLACALLAHMYADNTPLRDYEKVIYYADELHKLGFDLVEDFSDLYGMQYADPTKPYSAANLAVDAKQRNTKESIFEIQHFATEDKSDILGKRQEVATFPTYPWWVVPTHELVDLFEREPTDKRYPETIHYYDINKDGGGTYFNPPLNGYGYAKNRYPQMYKNRSNFSSHIKYRFADILLLKAEAFIMKSNPDLPGAADIINLIRQRAGITTDARTEMTTKEAAIDIYLSERRKELAFEGQRWNDLVRFEKVESVLNSFKRADPYIGSLFVDDFARTHYKFPIAKSVLDGNDMLTQNEGY